MSILRAARVATVRVLLTALVGLTVRAHSAVAATVDVFPGVGTLQAAIDAASDGDQLRVHPGTYTGAVSVTKRLTIREVPQPVVDNTADALIDAACSAPVALDIAADGVNVKGASHFANAGFGVFGGTATQIRIADHTKVKLQGVNTYPRTPACGSEQDGIEVSGSSSKVQLVGVFASEFPVAGVHLNGLSIGARILVKGSGRFGGDMTDNAIGLLIDNSANGAGLGDAGIKVQRMAFADNTVAGIRVVNADGVAIQRNTLFDGSVVTGAVGIDLDATADANLISFNSWSGTNMNSAFVDDGSGNCGTGNDFAVPPCP